MQLSKIYLILLVSLLFAACTPSQTSENVSVPKDEIIAMNVERVWVYLQFNVPYENDNIDTFWYYGQITRNMYNKIANNSIENGFIQLRNIYYYSSDDDIVKEYNDEDDMGHMIFRVENIMRIKELKRSPVVGQNEQQFEEITLEDIKEKIAEF